MAEIEVRDVPEEQRFVARIGDEEVGFSEYVKAGHRIVFTHTEVDPAYEGEGVGGVLARAALEAVRSADEALEVVPVCPFMAGWIMRHPEYAGLVTPALRGQFERSS
jgi:predicted GNAT family acetyltransferase